MNEKLQDKPTNKFADKGVKKAAARLLLSFVTLSKMFSTIMRNHEFNQGSGAFHWDTCRFDFQVRVRRRERDWALWKAQLPMAKGTFRALDAKDTFIRTVGRFSAVAIPLQLSLRGGTALTPPLLARQQLPWFQASYVFIHTEGPPPEAGSKSFKYWGPVSQILKLILWETAELEFHADPVLVLAAFRISALIAVRQTHLWTVQPARLE